VTAGVIMATGGLLAAGMTAGAATSPHKTTKFPDAIGKNDLQLKTTPSPQLNMGGSSFDGPFVQAWESQWNSDIKKTPFAPYAVTKSGTGRADMLNGTYNIGFSDFPLNQGGNCDVGSCAGSSYPSLTTSDFEQIPVVIGGVAVIYHFGTGVSGAEAALIKKYGLTFSGKVLGEVFAGKIKNWDSPAIVNGSLNKDLEIKGKDVLPNLPIVVESRTSGSGTTFGFTDYLSTVDPTDFPAATSSAFSAAAATYGTSALLDAGVHTTNGAIGYVEYSYAIINGSTTANLINASKKVVSLSEAGIAEAAAVGLQTIAKHGGFNTSKLANYSIVNQVGATVWPISLFSYAMVYKTQTNLTDAIAEVKFLDSLAHSSGSKVQADQYGQDLADENAYVPLPAAMQAIARADLLGVKVGGKVVLTATD
jgi:phosphate transport system substrate-binding protein